MPTFERDARFQFGQLPVPLLVFSDLAPMERLCWAVVASFTPGQDTSHKAIAERMGLSRNSRESVQRFLNGCQKKGYLKVIRPAQAGKVNDYKLVMPPHIWQLGAELDAQGLLQEKNQPTAPTTKPSTKQLAQGHAGAKKHPTQDAAEAENQIFFRAAVGAADERHPTKLRVPLASGRGAADERQGCRQPAAPINYIVQSTEEEVPPPHRLANKGKSSREGNGSAGGGMGLAVGGRDQVGAPAGWEGWEAAYMARHARRWIWTERNRQLALGISTKLGTTGTLGEAQRNYLAHEYHARHKCPHPLEALAKYLGDYVPAEVAPVCDHSKIHTESEPVKDENFVGEKIKVTCTSCGYIVKNTVEKICVKGSPEHQALLAVWETMRRTGRRALAEILERNFVTIEAQDGA